MCPLAIHFRVFLILCFSFSHLFPSTNASCCCCDCCCCCCCCCPCCCGSNCNNNNNNALALGTATSAPTDDLTLGAQTAANVAGLGPGLLPDGSTGQANQQQPKAPFRKRRKSGLGKLMGKRNCKMDCKCQNAVGRWPRFAVAMPNGSKPKQKPVLPSDWSINMGPQGQEPSLGPGLLPDGSTGRRQKTTGGNNFFNDLFGNDGGMMNQRRRRRRRRMTDGEEIKQETFQLGLIPMDPVQQKNTTFLRFLLGLIPEDQAGSHAMTGADGYREREEGGKPSNGQRIMAKRADGQSQIGEFTIQRQFFLVPIQSLASSTSGNNGGREMAVPVKKLQTVLPKPPLQFYKPVETNPENDQERYEPDYD